MFKAVWKNLDEILIIIIGTISTVLFVNVGMTILEKILMGGYN